MNSIWASFWETLPSEGGEWLSFNGNQIAVGGPARLCVWENGKKLLTVDAPSPAPGIPRFAGGKIFWGPGFADLNTGDYTLIKSLQPAMWPGGGERPLVYEWSPLGDKLVISFNTGDSLRTVRINLFNRDTLKLSTLWQGSGTQPGSVWFGRQNIVVGCRNPMVFDTAGKHIATIKTESNNVVFIGATADEKRIVVVDLNRNIFLVETIEWTILDCWEGPWLYGYFSADGKFVASLEAWGKIHFVRVNETRFVPAGEIAVDLNAVTFALGEGKIATVGGGELNLADLKVDFSNK